MSEAPERIWLDGDTEAGDCPHVRGPFEDPKYASEPVIPYIREDLHKAEIARLRERVKMLEGALTFYGSIAADPGVSPWNVYSEDYGKRARAALKEGES
jgi:hypothetical protein